MPELRPDEAGWLTALRAALAQRVELDVPEPVELHEALGALGLPIMHTYSLREASTAGPLHLDHVRVDDALNLVLSTVRGHALVAEPYHGAIFVRFHDDDALGAVERFIEPPPDSHEPAWQTSARTRLRTLVTLGAEEQSAGQILGMIGRQTGLPVMAPEGGDDLEDALPTLPAVTVPAADAIRIALAFLDRDQIAELWWGGLVVRSANDSPITDRLAAPYPGALEGPLSLPAGPLTLSQIWQRVSEVLGGRLIVSGDAADAGEQQLHIAAGEVPAAVALRWTLLAADPYGVAAEGGIRIGSDRRTRSRPNSSACASWKSPRPAPANPRG